MNFNYQVVFKHRQSDERVIFAGSTNAYIGDLIIDCKESLSHFDDYEIENVVYQPVKTSLLCQGEEAPNEAKTRPE